jgi:hypothetical protein
LESRVYCNIPWILGVFRDLGVLLLFKSMRDRRTCRSLKDDLDKLETEQRSGEDEEYWKRGLRLYMKDKKYIFLGLLSNLSWFQISIVGLSSYYSMREMAYHNRSRSYLRASIEKFKDVPRTLCPSTSIAI